MLNKDNYSFAIRFDYVCEGIKRRFSTVCRSVFIDMYDGCQICCNWSRLKPILRWWTLTREVTGANCSVFDLTRPGLEPPTFHTRSELSIHNATEAAYTS